MLRKMFWSLRTQINLFRNRGKMVRKLEIGPGENPIRGFESLNIVGGRWVDYVLDASKPLPFENDSFDLVYASHILEHVPWFHVSAAISEWVRILKPGGALEVWVPDALKICRVLVNFEEHGIDETANDGWYRFNPKRDPCVWAAGRIYTYGDGTGSIDHPNWHRALFTPRYLSDIFRDAGLEAVRLLELGEVRAFSHGWINLGVTGTKPGPADDRTQLQISELLGNYS